MERHLYKIKRISDGLYSSGGSWPNFTSKGKEWKGLGPLKNHLSILGERRTDIYNDCQIVEYIYTDPLMFSYPAKEFVEKYMEEKEKKRQERDLNNRTR